ncbi:MAG: hypothetical protein ACLFT7_05260 [Thermoplasmata archaeon]
MTSGLEKFDEPIKQIYDIGHLKDLLLSYGFFSSVCLFFHILQVPHVGNTWFVLTAILGFGLFFGFPRYTTIIRKEKAEERGFEVQNLDDLEEYLREHKEGPLYLTELNEIRRDQR